MTSERANPEILTPRQRWVGPLTSSVIHVLVLGFVALAARRHPVALRPMHLPGTLQGQHLMLTYSLGAPAESRQSSVLHGRLVQPAKPKLAPSPLQPAPIVAATQTSEIGSGAAGESALGDGDVRIALPQIHPRPKPDLSTLPRGTAGDVIVDVAIDDTGKVTATTLVRGLGGSVDTAVMQVLHDWTFTPATRNGQNIASEQEILIHYERG